MTPYRRYHCQPQHTLNPSIPSPTTDLPMSHPLPNRRQHPRHHKIEEEILQHNRRRLQIIPIDINRTNAANHPTPRDEKHPVPLPPPSNRMEALFLR